MFKFLGRYTRKAFRLGLKTHRSVTLRILRRMQNRVTVITKQGTLTISTRDVGIGAPLWMNRQYEYDLSLAAVKLLKDGGFLQSADVEMLDIGANIGVISIGLLLAGQVTRALAIEPAPENFELLCKNSLQNSL